MSIKVKFFASLRESLGRSENLIEQNLSKKETTTVAEIWSLSTNNAELPANMLAAINMDYVDLSHRVKDGDEVAFFPPVTGG